MSKKAATSNTVATTTKTVVDNADSLLLRLFRAVSPLLTGEEKDEKVMVRWSFEILYSYWIYFHANLRIYTMKFQYSQHVKKANFSTAYFGYNEANVLNMISAGNNWIADSTDPTGGSRVNCFETLIAAIRKLPVWQGDYVNWVIAMGRTTAEPGHMNSFTYTVRPGSGATVPAPFLMKSADARGFYAQFIELAVSVVNVGGRLKFTCETKYAFCSSSRRAFPIPAVPATTPPTYSTVDYPKYEVSLETQIETHHHSRASPLNHDELVNPEPRVKEELSSLVTRFAERGLPKQVTIFSSARREYVDLH